MNRNDATLRLIFLLKRWRGKSRRIPSALLNAGFESSQHVIYSVAWYPSRPLFHQKHRRFVSCFCDLKHLGSTAGNLRKNSSILQLLCTHFIKASEATQNAVWHDCFKPQRSTFRRFITKFLKKTKQKADSLPPAGRRERSAPWRRRRRRRRRSGVKNVPRIQTEQKTNLRAEKINLIRWFSPAALFCFSVV